MQKEIKTWTSLLMSVESCVCVGDICSWYDKNDLSSFSTATIKNASDQMQDYNLNLQNTIYPQ